MRALLIALALLLVSAASADARSVTVPWSSWYSFAPYVDLSAWPPPELSDIRDEGGAKDVTLGFVVNRTGSTGCEPRWGGYDAYPATGDGAYRLADVQAHRAAGGRVVVSFGGQAGRELALDCTEEELEAAYREVIETYGVTHVDFDIEGSAVEDVAANTRRARALAAVLRELAASSVYVNVGYTVAVLPRGLLPEDLAMLENVVANDVRLAHVNLMAMNYGAAEAPDPDGRLDEYAAQAALAARNQLRRVWPNRSDAQIMRQIGVTPMIGINDVAAERFSVQDARDLAAWAQEAEIGSLGMWSTGRDKPCDTVTEETRPDCSGVTQQPWDFTKALGTFDNRPNHVWGMLWARSDFNGDGVGDLAVGAPGENGGAGAVHIFYGRDSGMIAGTRVFTQDTAYVADVSEAGDEFGKALAPGDFNGDGRADLAIGVPGENGGAGAVAVLYSGNAGLQVSGNERWSQSSEGVDDAAGAGDRFGAALAARQRGDSKLDDLLIGAPDEDLGRLQDAGAVHMLRGVADGLTATGSQYFTQSSPGVHDSPEAGDRFGAALATGETGRSYRGDVAIGAPGENAGAGAVHMLFGVPSGISALDAKFWTQNSAGVADTSEPGDGFGSSLALGNMDGRYGYDHADQEAEVAIGVPGEDLDGAADAGGVHVLRSDPNGPTAAYSQWWTQASEGIADAPEAGDEFGATVASGDFNHNGVDDLAMGAPGENADAGVVHALYSRVAGLSAINSQVWSQASEGIEDAPGAGDRFGAALMAGNYGYARNADLAVGAPGEGLGPAANAGVVHIINGYEPNGLIAQADLYWHQGIPNIPDDPEAGDQFGASLTG